MLLQPRLISSVFIKPLFLIRISKLRESIFYIRFYSLVLLIYHSPLMNMLFHCPRQLLGANLFVCSEAIILILIRYLTDKLRRIRNFIIRALFFLSRCWNIITHCLINTFLIKLFLINNALFFFYIRLILVIWIVIKFLKVLLLLFRFLHKSII